MSFADEFHAAFLKRTIERNYVSIALAHRLADYATAQAGFESAGFTSPVFKRLNNAIGYKYYSGSIWQAGKGTSATDGGAFAHYDNVQDCACELADWIKRRRSLFDSVDSMEDYAQIMIAQGYAGATPLEVYVRGCLAYYHDSGTAGLPTEQPALIETAYSDFKASFGLWLIVAALVGAGSYVLYTFYRASKLFSKLV